MILFGQAGLVPGYFYRVLLAKSLEGMRSSVFCSTFLIHSAGFLGVLILGALWIIGTAAADSCTRAAAEAASVGWREELVKKLNALYFAHNSFYQIANKIDNPYTPIFHVVIFCWCFSLVCASCRLCVCVRVCREQRITQDVDRFTQTLSDTAYAALSAPIVIMYDSVCAYVKSPYH